MGSVYFVVQYDFIGRIFYLMYLKYICLFRISYKLRSHCKDNREDVLFIGSCCVLAPARSDILAL